MELVILIVCYIYFQLSKHPLYMWCNEVISDSFSEESVICRIEVRASAYLEISEGHELDDVSCGDISSGRTQQFVVAVEELHRAEVCPAHTHYDDGHGQIRGFYNSSACLVHVRDHAIGDDEQHVVLLRMEMRTTSAIKYTQSGLFKLFLGSFPVCFARHSPFGQN